MAFCENQGGLYALFLDSADESPASVREPRLPDLLDSESWEISQKSELSGTGLHTDLYSAFSVQRISVGLRPLKPACRFSATGRRGKMRISRPNTMISAR